MAHCSLSCWDEPDRLAGDEPVRSLKTYRMFF
jgi:hypothetical protein